jgi:hypothetical protein
MKGICGKVSLVTGLRIGEGRGNNPSDVEAKEGQEEKAHHDAAHHGEKVPPRWKETRDERMD